MHELSVVSGLVESVLEFVESHAVKRVAAVRLQVGELAQLEVEQLRFCYEAMIEKTAMEGSTLEIEPISAEVNCAHCSYHGPPKYWEGALSGTLVPTLQCPTCGHAAEAVRGHECSIKSIQYVA
ncbi:MAG TPA: hydrogenase maturation nickel metallochaperone HypA [Verrucomicrobiae bacterium]|jgi:hydrogenase nickel incorporation protein HypA/HybF|nr:hydrogenase maturation nickel metallochaperone HypA [Verrucomicrobiae bacterium]